MIAILAKAPIPGFAKTRLIPQLGANAAAELQATLTERAVVTALASETGPVVIWAAPDIDHPLFHKLAASRTIALARQPDGDLGARMLAAMIAADGPALVIGTDCPALTPDHLRDSADILRRGTEAVIIPAEDGGYVLIGARRPLPALFSNIHWGTPDVMEATRGRMRERGILWDELAPLWDVDRPEDLARMVIADGSAQAPRRS